MFVVLKWPRPWPPAKEGVLISKETNGAAVALVGRPDGGLTLRVTPSGGATIQHLFRPLEITGGGKLLLDITWNGNTAQLRINGTEIERGNGPAIVLTTPNENAPARRLHTPADVGIGATRSERLLVATIEDLRQKAECGDWYPVLQASGLLRHLLLDGLMDKANARFRLRPVFTTNDFTSKPPLPPSEHWINLDPSVVATKRVLSLDIQQFLAAECLIYRDHRATVKDIIRACANVKGAVHLGNPRSPGEKIVVAFDDVTSLLGLDASLLALRGLCRIVVDAMAPLVDAIIVGKATGRH